MPEETINDARYLSLKDVSKILNKKEAALRARIKRGNLDAVQRPMQTGKRGSKRFRYMIPLEAARDELAGMVSHESVLQHPLEDGEDPNLYQIFCEILSKHPNGYPLAQIRWHLERYYGLSLSEASVREFLSPFNEFEEHDGAFRLPQPLALDAKSERTSPAPEERPAPEPQDASTATNGQSKFREYENRLGALESKIELLIQLLSTKLT